MPDQATVIVKDTTTGQPKSIPLSEYESAISSGKYEKSAATQVTTNRLGTQAYNEPQDALGVIGGGEGVIPSEYIGARQGEQTQRESYDDFINKALTFGEGATDALSFGLLHERGDEADLRREINSGSALLGELTGTAIGLGITGPVNSVAGTGERVGAGLAKLILGNEGRLAQLGTRTFGEAGIGAALGAAGSAGHQVWDSILENKPIAAEAIAHEAGLGALMGGSMGLLSGAFSRAASRELVEIGSGSPEFIEQAGRHFDTSIKELDSAINQHGNRIGLLQKAVDDDLFPGDFLPEREKALVEAQKAQKVIHDLGSATDSLKSDAKSASKFQDALEDYHNKTKILDDLMTPKIQELGMTPQNLEQPIQGPISAGGDALIESGSTYKQAIGANERMAASPEMQAQYKANFGREWKPIEAVNGKLEGNFGASEENLGGKVTKTSEQGTNVQSIKLKPVVSELKQPILRDYYTDVDIAKNPGLVESEGHAPSPELQSLKDKLAEVAANKTNIETNPSPINQEANAGAFQDSLDKFHEQLKVFDKSNPAEQLKNMVEKGKGEIRIERHKEYKKFIDEWFDESKKSFRGSPGDRAITNIDNSFADLHVKTGGRMDSAGSLELAKDAGFKPATSQLGDRFQQAWSLGQTSKLAADASRVSIKGLADNSPKSLLDKTIDYAKRRVGGKIGAAIGGALIGHQLAGGEAGYYIGAAVATGYIGFGGKVAGTIGRISQKMVEAGDALLSGRRASVAARAIAISKPWSYSEKGPIKDPVERIQEIQRIAAHPELIATRIAKSSGDLQVVHPELHDLLTKVAEHRIIALSVRAPKIMWDVWGQPIKPAAGALRRFIEYENAVNDLEGTLNAIKSGGVTKDMADGIRDGWPAFSKKLSVQLLDDPSKLQSLSRERLRSVELITGAQLTRLSDGNYVERQQSSWVTANQNSAQQKPSGKPQAFKIGKEPQAQGTSTQQINGRAPGN